MGGIDMIMRGYLQRAEIALRALSRQGRNDEALPLIERLEALAADDLSEPGHLRALTRDGSLLETDSRRENPFIDGEDTGVMTSAPRVVIQKTCPTCGFSGHLTHCPNDGQLLHL